MRRRPRSPSPRPARTCGARSDSRAASCPARALRPPRHRCRGGTSQQSVWVAISLARSHVTAAATRARSGVKSARAPKPDEQPALALGVRSASDLNERAGLARGEQLARALPATCGGGSSPSKTPTATVSAAVAAAAIRVCGRDLHGAAARYPACAADASAGRSRWDRAGGPLPWASPVPCQPIPQESAVSCPRP